MCFAVLWPQTFTFAVSHIQMLPFSSFLFARYTLALWVCVCTHDIIYVWVCACMCILRFLFYYCAILFAIPLFIGIGNDSCRQINIWLTHTHTQTHAHTSANTSLSSLTPAQRKSGIKQRFHCLRRWKCRPRELLKWEIRFCEQSDRCHWLFFPFPLRYCCCQIFIAFVWAPLAVFSFF